MVEFADQPINLTRLTSELRALNLPGFKEVGRYVSRRDPPYTGESVPSDPYLWIESDPLSDQQVAAVRTVLVNHNPAADPPTATALAQQEQSAALLDLLSQYQSDMIRLDQIVAATAPTNAQVIAAVRDLASIERRTRRFLYARFAGNGT